MTLVIARRFRGPATSGNGGYTCGLVAGLVGGTAEITLRRPPPLDRPLDVTRSGETVIVEDGGEVVAEGVPAVVDLEPPDRVSLEQAADASSHYAGFAEHSFPECFVCGPQREEGDGLRIFAGPLAGRQGLVAAPWTPAADVAGADGLVRPEFVWASLDCPGAFAVGFAGRGATVLGRLAARIDSRPRPGEPHVVVGWPLGEEGRKLFAGTALFSAAGEVRGVARAVWVTPRV